MKKILQFIFGKSPPIFNQKGQIVHQLPDEIWQRWHNRTRSDPQYNWRMHAGTKSGRRDSFK